MQGLFAGGYNAASGGPLPTPDNTAQDYFWFIYSNGTVDLIDYFAGSFLVWDSQLQAFEQLETPTFFQIRGKSDEATRWPKWDEVTNKPTNLVALDAQGDISVRMIHSNHPTQSIIPKEAAIAFRISSTTDDLTRFADVAALRNYLGTMKDSDRFSGKTLDDVKAETRLNLVPTSLTINGYRLSSSITLSALDFGLGNVANYGNTSSPAGTSTTLYATQRCAYEAAAAPRLVSERKRYVGIVAQMPSVDDVDGIYHIIDEQAKTYETVIKYNGVIYDEA